MTAITVLSSLGGALAFIGAIWVILKSVFGQISATKANTAAVENLTKQLGAFQEVQRKQGEDIAYLKGRRETVR